MNGSAARKTMGFTLVEMLVAVALGIIIVGIVTTVFSQATVVFKVSQAKIECANNARVAMSFISGDLAGAFIRSDGAVFQSESWGTADSLQFFTTPSLSYDTTDPSRGEVTGLLVRYYIDASHRAIRSSWAIPAGSTAGDWWTTVTPPASIDDYVVALGFDEIDDDRDGSTDEDPINGINDDVLTGDTRTDEDPPALDVRYFDGTNWVDTWDSTNSAISTQYRRLPQAVQVRLIVVDANDVLNPAIHPEANPYVLSRIILVGTQSTGQ